MKPTIKLPDKLQPLYDDYRRYVILEGGRGGAKSHGVATSQLLRGRQRPMLFLDAREIQNSIKDSVHSLLEKKIEEIGLGDFYDVLNTEIRGKNGTKFIFAGLRHNVDSIKSIEDADECWVEEAQVVSDATWKKLIPTIRKEISPCCFVRLDMDEGEGKPCSKCRKIIPREKIIPSRIVITYNPDLEEDPTYQRFNINKPTNSFLIKMNYRDNPWFPSVLEDERLDCLKNDFANYPNIWEGKPRAAVEGAIYAEHLQKARDDGRIGVYKYDDRYPVSIFLDIGWNDHTSICFLQFINNAPRIIDCYQNQFKKTPFYIQILKDKNYNYNRIVLPHDANNEHANAERTWLQIFIAAFPNANVTAGEKRSIELRLEATKNMFDLLEIDKENNVDLLSALAHYHYATDPNTGKGTREPFHGPESDYADSFGYMCLEMKEPSKPRKPKAKKSIYSGMPR